MSSEKNHIVPISTGSFRRIELENNYLDPTSVKLDDRSTSALLDYMARLSEQFWYYTEDDKKDGDWSDFFKSDMTCLLALIGEYRIEQDHRKVMDFVSGVAESKKKEDKGEFLFELFHIAFKNVFQINGWYKTFTRFHIEHPFYQYLKEIIWKKLSFALRDLYGYYHHSIQSGFITDKEKIDGEFKKFNELDVIWNYNPFPNISKEKAHTYQAIEDFPEFLNGIRQTVKLIYSLCDSISKEARKQFVGSLHSGKTEPHIALILSFLKLFKHQQSSLNQLVSKHMDFYYEKVLDFHPSTAVADQVFLILKLGKGLNYYSLPTQTSFLGGIDASGQPIQFQIDKPFLLTPSIINSYYALRLNKNASPSNNKQNILFISSVISGFDKPVVDQETGLEQSFPVFGGKTTTQVKPYDSSLGFAIASPELMLEGGRRQVKICINPNRKTPPSAKTSSKQTEAAKKVTTIDLSDGVVVLSISTAKGWMTIEDPKIDLVENQLTITFGFNAGYSAISGYNPKVHGIGYDTKWPLLRFAMNQQFESTNNAYNLLSDLKVSRFTIQTKVQNSPVLTINTSNGKVSPTATFPPFGANPVVGSQLVVGSYEAFIKNTRYIKLNVGWVNLPDDAKFSAYYDAYNDYLTNHLPDQTKFLRASYECRLCWLDIKTGKWKWDVASKDTPLFPSTSTNATANKPKTNDVNQQNQTGKISTSTESNTIVTPITYSFTLNGFQPDYELPYPLTYSDKSKAGFVSMELSTPELTFGSAIYPQVVAEVALENTTQAVSEVVFWQIIAKAIKKLIGKLLAKSDNKSGTSTFKSLPNKPYVPKMKGLSITYGSFHTIIPGKSDVDQLYRIHPFGIEQVNKVGVALIPEFEQDHYAFLGFEQLNINTPLTLFLSVKDRVDAVISEGFSPLIAEVLTDTGWEKIKVDSDGTYGLNKSGIVRMNIPDNISNQNPIMPIKQYWIRISASEQSGGKSHLKMIATNAVLATRLIDGENGFETFENIIAGSIKKTKNPIQEIGSVSQPYSSFGGEDPEGTSTFYERVSQRIGHKNRLVSVSDYEHLVLDQFKEVYQVKSMVKKVENKPQLVLGIVPTVQNIGSVDLYRPIAPASLCAMILKKLLPLMSPHLLAIVEPAHFDVVRLEVDLTFTDFEQSMILKETLNIDLKDYLSPWVDGNDLAFTKEVLHVNDIVAFILSQKYVNSLHRLKIFVNENLVYDKGGQEDQVLEKAIVPTSPLNILVPATRNQIIDHTNTVTKQAKTNRTHKEEAVS